MINNCYYPKITDKVIKYQFVVTDLDIELVTAGDYFTDKRKNTDKPYLRVENN